MFKGSCIYTWVNLNFAEWNDLMFPQKHIFLFTEDEPIYSLPFSFHFPFNWKNYLNICRFCFRESMKLGCKKKVHYKWTLNTPVLRRLSNLFTIEISTVHVLNIYFYTVLVQEQLCQHWSFSCHPNGRYRRDRARFNKHAFFKALPLVFTCGIAAVLYYNSPKCHNYIIIKIMWYMMMF